MENKQTDIIVVGSVNFDTFLFVDRNPEVGETISANSIMTCCGGKGANMAGAAAKLGCKVKFVGQVGDDSAGKYLLNELTNVNVDVSDTLVLPKTSTGQAFIIAYNNNSIIIVGGANIAWEKDNELEERLKPLLSNTKIILLQREVPEYVNIVASKLGKNYGATVILDMGGKDEVLSKELLANIDILSPNETELKRVFGKSISSQDDDLLIEELNLVRKSANNPNLSLLMKLGSKGCKYIGVDNIAISKTPILFKGYTIIDTTGAGDCFVSAFACEISRNSSIETALVYANTSAFLCITKLGTLPSMPSKSDVEALLELNQ